jgi:hypothetical protein
LYKLGWTYCILAKFAVTVNLLPFKVYLTAVAIYSTIEIKYLKERSLLLDKITIRPIDHGDAERFFEILSSERFLYFVRPESLEEKKEYLKSAKLKE